MRREYRRAGWLILSAGRLWDDWAYPTEAAAKTTAERCNVPEASIVESDRQGYIDNEGRQYSRRLLLDRKKRS